MDATATAGANIAIVKYWGTRDLAQRLPTNDSISLTLDTATTTTTVRFEPNLEEDVVILQGKPASEGARARVSAHLDRMRMLADVSLHAYVESSNTFPIGAGVASSASGFAALTAAGSAALGLSLSQRGMSVLARLGSGSACRSMVGGWAHWLQGTCHEDSYATQIAPPEHWDVRDIIAIVTDQEKPVPSTEGHRRALTSPLFPARLARVKNIVPRVREAIYGRDFRTLGALAESDALSMHAIMLTSAPPLLYWLPATVELIHKVGAWRAEGVPCYFTLDAGPNVHILTVPEAVQEIEGRLNALSCVQRILVCGPGTEPRVHPPEENGRSGQSALSPLRTQRRNW